MRLRSVYERRLELLEDRHIQELISAHPELGAAIDGFLWAYPRSPSRSRRSLALLIAATVGAVIGVRRLRRSQRIRA